MKLTKSVVDGAKPDTKDVWLWDSELPGFGVRVQPSGRKTYVVRYRVGATQRKQTLARCTDLPPDRARDLARKTFAAVAEGGDPAAERRAARAPKAADTRTVEKLFKAYVAHMRAQGRVSADEVERALLTAKVSAAADALGRDLPAAAVTPADVVQYVARFFKAGHRGAANKARTYISGAYAWAIKSANDYTVDTPTDWGVTVNPAAAVARDAGATNQRERNLSVDELRELWQAAVSPADSGFSLETAVCIQTLIGCGQRVQETLRIDGGELDLDAALWRMPKEKTKGKKRPHAVPLPRQVIPGLRALKELHGDGPLFPGRLGKDRLEHRSINQAIGRWLESEGVTVAHFQTRDLRRTWKSRTADAGIDRFTRDLIQQHAKGDTGSKHYDMADYGPQMRAAMDRWSDWLEAALHPEKPPLVRVA